MYDDDDDDIKMVFELKPTREQAELAARLMLPPTFFCYTNRPGYVSDDDTDGKTHTLLNRNTGPASRCTSVKSIHVFWLIND